MSGLDTDGRGMHEHGTERGGRCLAHPAAEPVPPADALQHPAVHPPGRVYALMLRAWTRPPWLAPLAMLGCVGAALAYVSAFDPTDVRRDPIGPCLLRATTGLDCPGCGGTRMVWFLLQGNLPQAARHHAAALVMIPVLVWLFVAFAVRRTTGRRLPMARPPMLLWAAFGAFWAVLSVVRNLPWEPFSSLWV